MKICEPPRGQRRFDSYIVRIKQPDDEAWGLVYRLPALTRSGALSVKRAMVRLLFRTPIGNSIHSWQESNSLKIKICEPPCKQRQFDSYMVRIKQPGDEAWGPLYWLPARTRFCARGAKRSIAKSVAFPCACVVTAHTDPISDRSALPVFSLLGFCTLFSVYPQSIWFPPCKNQICLQSICLLPCKK